MAVLDGDKGELIKCDRCGTVFDISKPPGLWLWAVDEYEMWDCKIFFTRPKPNLGDFCKPCAVEITPLIHALRDIDELGRSVNKLERAIRAK